MNKLRDKKLKKSEKKRTQRVARSVSNIIAGTFLTRKNAARQLPLLIIMVIMALIYISNSYSAEKLALSIERLKKENEVLRYEHILIKSQLMNYIRQSELAKKLKGTGLKESTVPPYKIFTNRDRK